MSHHRLHVLVILGALAVGVPPASAQRGPSPPRVGACFYEDAGFRGQYFCASAGATMPQVPEEANDRISSIRIFGPAEVVVFKDADFRGSSHRYDSDVYDLAREGFNDRVSSFHVNSRGYGSRTGNWGGAYGGGSYGYADADRSSRGEWYPNWDEAVPDVGACFYADRDFRGRHFCERIGSVVTQVPSGTNDEISSVRLFGNASVTVFQDRAFSGGSRRFDYDIRDLRREGWDDTISSFRVTSRGHGYGGYGGGAYGGGSYGGGAWGSGHPGSSGGHMTYQQAKAVVRSAYLSVLDREPDPASSSYVSKVMNDNWSEQQVRNELMRSQEYKTKHRGR